MATPGICTDTLPTTAQAFFLGSLRLLATVSDLVCDQRYSDIKPSTEGEVTPRGRGFGPWGEARGSGLLFFSQVIFKVLDPGTLVEYPNNPKIQGNRPHSQSCTPCMLGQPDTGVR